MKIRSLGDYDFLCDAKTVQRNLSMGGILRKV